ncbi:uncharacterized protein LOC107045668 [Diachasma alloeum]|uniref:uncharacterized protein LOC107045668 n=1 Tax=Diachasma alloeum TaxID=454923 RepID=UPI00073825C4|nr:uncharacterized protein LOC107045668 [Diachasma alloeum]
MTRVTVKSPRGFSSRARVLIDQGSEVSFISENLVNQLHLPRKSTTLKLIGIGGVNSGSTRGLVSVALQAINGKQQVQISAHILKRLTAILPSFSCASANISSLENLQLADQQYLKPGPIDIIIGADNYGRIIRDEVVKSKQSKVVGQRTVFVFVCFTTSAVHLELVNRQTTEAFLGAYKRFTGRRGIPAVMYSDNATTFVGAADQLERLYHQASKENQRVQAALATNGTQWSFSPPRAPHFGGKWEAAVKSTKHHLKRVLGTTTLTFEELNTVLVQIEACLNSRPICPMSDDPEDLQVLTSGHFLIGEPLQIVPESSYVDENPLKMRRWNLVTRIVQQFWSRWSKECLQRYQAIYKWKTRQQNIEVGNMVLMVDDNLPPAQWPIARVIATRPGADGLTRVATVRTSKAEVGRHQDGSPNLQNITAAHSVFDRPITKLCLLPIDPPTPEQPPEEDHPDDEDDQQQGDIQELQD